MTLDGLEEVLKRHFKTQDKVHLIRFADDAVITAKTKALLEEQVKPLVEQFLAERGLKLSPEKTQIVHIEQGCDFLGQNIRKYNGKLLIKPAKGNVKNCMDKVRSIVTGNKQAKTGHLIVQLNPVIRGWARFHRHAVSKETFGKVDHAIWNSIRRWVRRRHPKKPWKWIIRKYFKRDGMRNWVLFGSTKDAKEVSLARCADIPIERHTKIKGQANPFDPSWECYFEDRERRKWQRKRQGMRKLVNLWMDQQGHCPVCGQRIVYEEQWHAHHIIPRVEGGPDTRDNLVLLHPTCHRQVHALGWKVSKPAPDTGLTEA